MASSKNTSKTRKVEKETGASPDLLKKRVASLPDSLGSVDGVLPQTAEDFFEESFRSDPSVKLLIDPVSGAIVDANDAACRFYGYSHKEFVSLKFDEINTIDASSVDHELKMAINLEQRVFNFKHRMSSSELRDVESFTQPVHLYGRRLLLATIIDVSEIAKSWRIQALLLEISEASSITEDLYHLIFMIRERLNGFLDTKNLFVALYDGKNDSYSFPFIADEYAPDGPPGDLKGGLTDFVRRTGRSLLVDHKLLETLIERGDVRRVGENAKLWLGVPLRTGKGVIGVIAVQHYTDDKAYDESDLELMEFISGSLAVTIERRMVEEALRESETRFRTFIHRSPDGIYSLDMDEPIPVNLPQDEQINLIRQRAKFSECNETFCSIYGFFSPSEIIGKTLVELPTYYDNDYSTATVEKLVHSNYKVTDGLSFETLDNGEEKVYFNQFMGIIQNAMLVRIWGVQRDITEQTVAERQLQIQQTHLTRFIENSAEGIVFTDPDDVVKTVNREFLRMFKLKEENVLGKKNVLTVPDGKEEESDELVRAARENRRVNIESIRKRSDGKFMNVSVLGTPIQIDGQHYGTYWVYRDVSQQKRSEIVQSALFHIAEAASTSSDLEELLKTVHDQLGRLIDTKNLYVALYDPASGGFRFEYFVDEADTINIGEIYQMPDSLTEFVRTQGPHLFVSEAQIREHLSKYSISPEGEVGKSWLGVPLRTPSGVIGVYVVQSYTEENAYDQNDMDLLEFVSGHIASAIEHKRWQDEIRTSEARYRALFSNSPVGVLLFDSNMIVTDLNARHAEIMGSTREGMLGFDMKRLRQKNLVPLMQRALKGETTYYDGHYFATVSDRELWLSITFSPHISTGGENIGGIAIVVDQTEQKKTERIAEMNRAYLEQLFQGAPEAIILLDPRFRAIRVNNEFANLFGYSSDEVLGRSLQDLILPEGDEAELHLAALKAVTKGETVSLEETVCHKRNGSKVDVSLLGTPIEIEGNVIALYGIYRDITQRKQATETLAAEKDRLAVTLASIGEGVITTDTEGNIQLMNDAAEKLTGWKAKNARGRSFAKIFPLRDPQTRNRFESPADLVLRQDSKSWTRESILVAKNGTERTIVASASPIHGYEGRLIGAVVVFRDVTEQRILEEEIQKIERLESVGVLAGGIAHDFNNILSAVLGNISLAKMTTDQPVVQAERILEAEKAALRARDLTQQLLTFSRGGKPIRKSQTIDDIIQESATFALRGSNVRHRMDIAEDLWPAEVDGGQIGRVINNLVINADQAMPEGGSITITASNIEVTADMALPLSAGKYVKISVEDEGVGIPEEYLQRIFDPFFTTKQRGSGLGLASSFSIIQKHDGHITVESLVGKGTAFTIYLPATEKVELEALELEDGEYAGEGRILVMDDEEAVRNVVKAMLEKIGFRCDAEPDGIRAIEQYQKAKLEDDPYRAVIMDLTVPGGMGGAEAIEHLRKLDPKVVAVVSSGYSNDPIMSNHEEYGFKGVVAKPYKMDELRKVLRQVLV